ncbi:MAG: GerMN domain-containing protein, partial [Proteobacteria bacterium]|nr:GerMN domain-containing protein [Pseudomonadota bacterium]
MATKKKSPAKPIKKGAKAPAKSDRWKSKKSKKKPRKLGGWWIIINIFSFGLIIGTGLVIYFGPTPDRTPPPVPVTPTREVTIYFGSTDGETLRGVERTVDEGILSNEIAGAVELLLQGPGSGNRKIERTVPAGTRLLGVRVTGSTAVVNLSRELV